MTSWAAVCSGRLVRAASKAETATNGVIRLEAGIAGGNCRQPSGGEMCRFAGGMRWDGVVYVVCLGFGTRGRGDTPGKNYPGC